MSRTPDLWQTFARNLRAARARAGLTQADLADALGVSQTMYARYEAGRRHPSVGRLRLVCEVLHVSADTLLFGTTAGVEPPPPRFEPPAMRRLMRRIRRASPGALRIVERLLDEIDAHNQR